MINIKSVSIAVLTLLIATACAAEQATVAPQPPEAAPIAEVGTKPSFSASQTETVTAVVEAINYETREVTLVDDAGEPLTFVVGDNVRNLNQVSVGDVLVIEHLQTVDIVVLPGDGLGPDQAEMMAAGRTEQGEMPGAVAIDSVVIVSVVKLINLDNNTFILEEPDGTVKEYVAMNPENLKLAEVGDLVVMTLTESLAVAVEKAE